MSDNFSGHPVSVLHHLHNWKNSIFYLTWIFDVVSIASHSHAPPRQVWLHLLHVLQQAAVDRSQVCTFPLSSPGWTNPPLCASPPVSPVLQIPDQFHCRISTSFEVVSTSKLNRVFQVQPGKCWIERNNYFLGSTSYTLANQAWDMVGLLHCKSSLKWSTQDPFIYCFLTQQPSARWG